MQRYRTQSTNTPTIPEAFRSRNDSEQLCGTFRSVNDCNRAHNTEVIENSNDGTKPSYSSFTTEPSFEQESIQWPSDLKDEEKTAYKTPNTQGEMNHTVTNIPGVMKTINFTLDPPNDEGERTPVGFKFNSSKHTAHLEWVWNSLPLDLFSPKEVAPITL